MERIPQGKYTPEFWLEAVKLVVTGLSVPEVSKRLSIPKNRLHKWGSIDRQGKLANVGKGQRIPNEQDGTCPLAVGAGRNQAGAGPSKKFAAYFVKESR